MTIQITNPHEFIKVISDAQRAERRRKVASLIPRVQVAPVSPETLKELASLNPDDFEEVLSHHPGANLSRKIESLEHALELFDVADRNVFECFLGFEAVAVSKVWGKQREDAIERVKLAVFTYSCALVTLEQMCRRISSAGLIKNLSQHVARHLDPEESAFIKQMRNHYSHKMPLEPSSVTEYRPGSITTRFEFKSSRLLLHGEFTGAAKMYLIKQLAIDLNALVTRHSIATRNLYADLRSEVTQSIPPEVQDFRRCERAHRRHAKRVMLRLAREQKANKTK
jgi:hypothetical protein